jgi:electron transport complex protein RnfC
MFKLWPFIGGVRLDGHKRESSFAPLQLAPLPKVLIYPLLMRNGQNAKLMVAVGERVLKGQVIAAADGTMNPPFHAATSGWVRCIEQRPLPHPSGLSGECIVIDVDGVDESVEFQGIADYAGKNPADFRDKIHAAGIVGLGGAAFPTAVKITPPKHLKVDTLVLNGAECEPYITCDDSLLRHFPHEVLGGANILLHILGITRCLLAVEDDMQCAIAALEKAKSEGNYSAIKIVPVPTLYPTGGERQLVKVLTGREIPTQGIPAEIGVVCQNVATAAAVHRAVIIGEPLISRIVTVTGQGVRRPQNLLARIGTPIAELVEHCGGYADSARRLILGGPMMGFALPSDDLPITKAANCVLIAGQDELVGEKQALPCIRCGACATACPVNLLPQQLYWHARANNDERLMEYHLPDCIECGCCDIVCPSHIPLVQYFRSAKSKVAAKERERLQADHARLRYESRQARKERETLEKGENAKRKKELLAKRVDAQK